MTAEPSVRDRIARQVEAHNGCEPGCPACARTADTLAATSPMIPNPRTPEGSRPPIPIEVL